MELRLYAYYRVASGGVCKIIDMGGNDVSYIVFDNYGKKISSSGGRHVCSKNDFRKVVVERVRPKAKPKKEKPKKDNGFFHYQEY